MDSSRQTALSKNHHALDDIPFAWIRDQIAVKPLAGTPTSPATSMEDLTKAVTILGDKIVLVEEEQSAILLQKNYQHLIFSSHFSNDYVTLVGKFRGLCPIPSMNAYKLIS